MLLHLFTFIFLFFNIGFGYSENITNPSESKICISKCCPYNQYVGARKKCVSYIEDLTFDDLKVFDEDKMFYRKNARDMFEFVPGKFSNQSFRREAVDLSRINFRMYLTETGVLSIESPNAFNRWTDVQTENYCVDYRVNTNMGPTPFFWSIITEDEPQQSTTKYLLFGTSVSCFFLLLVLIVYIILDKLRHLGDRILISYVVSLFFAYLLLTIMNLNHHTLIVCLGLTYSIYFSFLASFCWMNIMSYDIWWSSRGYVKGRLVNRRGECFKFIMYCLYGFGLPLAMTIMFAVINVEDIMIDFPWFITPNVPKNGCFLEGGEKLLYLYVPMLILILCNWLFFVMTTFNIWRLSRGTAVLYSAAAGTPAAHRTHRHRFLVYLKLSVVMGLSWVLEVASFLSPKLSIWYISDLYNVLIGLMIFLIFVCTPKTLEKLRQLCRRESNSGWVVSTTHVNKSLFSNIVLDNTLPIDKQTKDMPSLLNYLPSDK